MSNRNNFQGFLAPFLAILIYFFTTNPLTKDYSVYAFIIVLMYCVSTFMFKRNNTTLLTYLSEAVVLFLIGITGWFFSPFFFWVYLLAIAMTFLFDTLASLLFILAMATMFVPNIGQREIGLDLFTLFSFGMIIPISYFLRTRYLHLKEQEKNIIILQKNHDRYKNNVSEVLDNKIVQFSHMIRESLTDIKQIASFGMALKDPETKIEQDKKIVSISERALHILEDFEEDTTGITMEKTK